MPHNKEIPKQAVILAGGRGSRLRPITDTIPKPMIEFNGKPFLHYIVELLKEQGFERILLLLGYLPGVVQDYFGDGKSFGVQIDYSITSPENETGRRIKLAQEMVDSCFLLLYCDNYWPMRMKEMWEQFVQSGALAQITVYNNKDNYSRSNVLLDDDQMVIHYDKSRSSDNLQGVEIGFAIIQKKVLDLLPDKNLNFEKEIYPTLSEKGQLSAYLTSHRYYSVGSVERLKITESFFKRRPAIILDRDGVLNVKAAKGQYVRTWNEFRWLPGAKEAVRLLKDLGYLIIVVTNQAGIAREMMTEKDLVDIHENMKRELNEMGGSLDAIYCCPHGWDESCECRKPKPGMLFKAQRDFNLDLSRIYFVGDDIRDKQAGDAAGCKTVLIPSDGSLLSFVKENIFKES